MDGLWFVSLSLLKFRKCFEATTPGRLMSYFRFVWLNNPNWGDHKWSPGSTFGTDGLTDHIFPSAKDGLGRLL